MYSVRMDQAGVLTNIKPTPVFKVEAAGESFFTVNPKP